MTDPSTSQHLSFSIDRSLLKGAAIALSAGGMLAFTGAFGMTGAGFGQRLIYWLPLMLAGAVWGHVCSRQLERWIDLDRQPWLAAFALTLAIGLPLTVVVWAYTVFWFEQGRHPAIARLVHFISPVLVVTAVVSVLNVFLQRQPVQTHAAPAGASNARFPDRLPPKLKGAAIHAVESEDHYLRIHTDRGSDLILMRLSDALAELEGLEGAQTHRGWWVARGAVRDVKRGDGRATLTLAGGVEAPVSRRYARALRDAGWY
ncbi:LytTR family DNA-binding domain-containing protein [Brevundimonas sp. PAMC22021]|uniref:LytTR family DNA-binding domain-containing protein n=1 Tax=Brevundimonas sp. PAMC22021 TaxID=2861285 RepID=UPI001C62A6B8|nr:LytTR family DNA-binding domain-containing protein [Brevundimonas sp. PAMC22021]QYF86992.1 LytTR family transcriptional regulator DNA-binding domain-containing protein [Brevundimonas sp. PAMC22021]